MRCPECGLGTGTGVELCTGCGATLAAPPPSACEAGPGDGVTADPVLDPALDPAVVETRFADIPPAQDTQDALVSPDPYIPPGRPRGRGLPGYAGWLLAGAFALALAAVLIVLWPSGRPREGAPTGGGGPAAPPRTPPQEPSQVSPPPRNPEQRRFYVDIFAAAPGYAQPGTSGGAVGELRKGTHYVFCKRRGQRMERNGGEDHNHWWLLTDLDEVYAGGGAARAWVPALYLTHWGNDEARDNGGGEIADCP